MSPSGRSLVALSPRTHRAWKRIARLSTGAAMWCASSTTTVPYASKTAGAYSRFARVMIIATTTSQSASGHLAPWRRPTLHPGQKRSNACTHWSRMTPLCTRTSVLRARIAAIHVASTVLPKPHGSETIAPPPPPSHRWRADTASHARAWTSVGVPTKVGLAGAPSTRSSASAGPALAAGTARGTAASSRHAAKRRRRAGWHLACSVSRALVGALRPLSASSGSEYVAPTREPRARGGEGRASFWSSCSLSHTH